jgi:hypothetical protein
LDTCFFAGEESTFAILIGSFATFTGTGVGIILPTLFISADQTDAESARGIEWTNLVEAIIFCVPLIPAIIFMKNRPDDHNKSKGNKDADNKKSNNADDESKGGSSSKDSKSDSKNEDADNKKVNADDENKGGSSNKDSKSGSKNEEADVTKDFTKKCISMITKDWKTFVSSMAFGMGFGLSLTIQAVISTILPETFSLLQVGITGVIFVGSGLLFGVIGQLLLETPCIKGHYDHVISFFFLVNTIVLIFIAIFLKEDTGVGLVYVFNAIGGFGLIAFTPFGIQSLIESAHPINEIIPTNWMFQWGQVFGIIGTYASSVASKEFRMWTMVIMLVPASIWVLFFHHTKYNQTGKERSQRRLKIIKLAEEREKQRHKQENQHLHWGAERKPENQYHKDIMRELKNEEKQAKKSDSNKD